MKQKALFTYRTHRKHSFGIPEQLMTWRVQFDEKEVEVHVELDPQNNLVKAWAVMEDGEILEDQTDNITDAILGVFWSYAEKIG